MKGRNPIVSCRHQPSQWQTIFCCNLILLFCFVAFPEDLNASPCNPEDRNAVLGKTSVDASVSLTIDLDPFHHPATPGPAPQEPPITDEKSGDGVDDDWSKAHLDLSPEGLMDRRLQNILLHLRISFHNRPGISLVILHHSWKSFLI